MDFKEIVVTAYNCKANLDDKKFLLEVLSKAAGKSGVKIVGHAMHEYEPQGLSIVLFLAESHISLYTWPERESALLEINLASGKNPMDVWELISQSLRPEKHKLTEIEYRM